VVTIKDRKVTAWRDYLDPLRVFAALEGRPLEPEDGEAGAGQAVGVVLVAVGLLAIWFRWLLLGLHAAAMPAM
jgi:hypothetical protein